MLGAGSGFTPRLINDLLRIPGDRGGTIGLVDTDTGRLETMHKVISRVCDTIGKGMWSVAASSARREVLPGSDYVINCIEVSGLSCVRFDNDIPARYGVDQCIGDTVGPGGLFKGLRTIPVWLRILRDIEALCPEALVINYTNPMGMMCAAASSTSTLSVIGLCHSVQHTSALLARRAGVPLEEMEWDCAGINHLSWFTTLRHRGMDLYPILIEKARRDLAGTPGDPDDAGDLVRKDMMVQFGAFITESSGHLSEYLPYYRKRADLRERYMRPGYEGESGFYSRCWPDWRRAADEERTAMLRGEKPVVWDRSSEYASWIIEAREKNQPYRIYGNLRNTTASGPLIDNLPPDGCVEVACMVDGGGIHPVRYGALPPHMAAPCDWNIRFIALGAQAAIERSKERAVQALMLDPLTAAVCSPAEIRRMAMELFEAEREFLEGYR
jgi:alpha-galactosidase